MDPVIVNKYSLHLEICLFAILLVLKLYECVLQTVAGPLVPNDLAR